MPVSPPTGNGVPCPWGCPQSLVLDLEWYAPRGTSRWHCSMYADKTYWHYPDTTELRGPDVGDPCPQHPTTGHCVRVEDVLGEEGYTTDCNPPCFGPTSAPPLAPPPTLGQIVEAKWNAFFDTLSPEEQALLWQVIADGAELARSRAYNIAVGFIAPKEQA